MLGCVLLEPEKVLPVLRGGFRVEQEWFYVPQHRVIWEGLCQMQDAGHAIDLVTFPQFLKDRMVLDQAGGTMRRSSAKNGWRARRWTRGGR